MLVRKDFRISLPDETGQLARLCRELCTRGVNIRTIAGIAGSPPVLSLITDHEEETREALKTLGLTFEETELLTIKVTNIPGEIATFAQNLAESGINISAVFLLGEVGGKGMIAFGVSDLEKSKQIAMACGLE